MTATATTPAMTRSAKPPLIRPLGYTPAGLYPRSAVRLLGPTPAQPTTTQDAAGSAIEPVRRGIPVDASTVNHVTSPERSLAT